MRGSRLAGTPGRHALRFHLRAASSLSRSHLRAAGYKIPARGILSTISFASLFILSPESLVIPKASQHEQLLPLRIHLVAVLSADGQRPPAGHERVHGQEREDVLRLR